MLALMRANGYICSMETSQTDIWQDDIVFLTDAHEACSRQYQHYYLHIFVTSGSMSFSIEGKHFVAHAGTGIILIEGKPVDDLSLSPDCQVVAMLLSNRYLRSHPININFNVRGLTFYFDHPLMVMTTQQMEQCLRGVEDIRWRLTQTNHLYFNETLTRAIENFTYDLFDIYTCCNSEQASKGGQKTLLSQQFIDLLKQHIREERMVDYYASQLFVTPKYLSRVCLQATGHNASYWISQFAVKEILEQITSTNLPLSEISTAFNFQSLSHFTRYVKKHTRQTPSAFRMKKK